VLFFNPYTYDEIAWFAYQSQIDGSLVLIAFSCAAALLLRRHAPPRGLWPWAIGLGAGFSAFWLNREDGLWLAVPLAIVLFPVAAAAYREGRTRAFARSYLLAAPLAIWALSVAAVCAVNGIVYGWATVVEVQAPEFVSAYASLARIARPPGDLRFPVPKAALDVAYTVSPAARELQPAFEGPAGDAWRDLSCTSFGACGDIAGTLFVRAFRSAVATSGHYTSGPAARAFYDRLSREVDAACDQKRIACDRKIETLVPAFGVRDLPFLAQNFSAALFSFVTLPQFSVEPGAFATPDARLARDYVFVTRSAYAATAGLRTYEGWLVAPGALRIEALAAGRPDASASVHFRASPDVAAAVARNNGIRDDAGEARFEITTACTSACELRITSSRGSGSSIPLEPGTRDAASRDYIYHLDSFGAPGGRAATHDFKSGVLDVIAEFYGRAIGWLALAALILLVPELVRSMAFDKRPMPAHGALGLAIVVAGVTLAGILAGVQTYSFPVLRPEYFSSFYPLVLLFIAIGFAVRVR